MAVVIVAVIYLAIELIFLCIHVKRKHSRERMTLQSLYKLMEVRVLNRTLQNRMTSEQAAEFENEQLFVRMEFLDAKPWMACLFAMDECVTIGRSVENKISIRDDLLSRIHCKIVMQNNRLYLQDMGTTNGTTVKRGVFGRIKLLPNNILELDSDDIICIGHYKIKVRMYFGMQVYT